MAGMQPAALSAGGDPRRSSGAGTGEDVGTYSRPRLMSIHDPSVSFEEYVYWARETRQEELGYTTPQRMNFMSKFGSKKDEKNGIDNTTDGKNGASMDNSPPGYSNGVSDEEWAVASRAVRTATWGAVFYLITTDILGPYSVPWAMAQMGYGPGITLYTVFGAFAGYSGWMLWKMFLGLDSLQYPIKTYGDIAFRVYGTIIRHCLNILQSIQLLFNVGIIVIGNGQGLFQVAKGNLCFIICCLVWVIAGFFLGQIRTLQKFGWIANFAIWLNLLVIFMTMGVVANSDPNYEAALASAGAEKGPVHRTAGPPEGVGFETQVVGLMQAVYSYGGAMLFCEFMAEMRRPFDFWKAMVCAQSFIFFFYLMFGLYVYSFQGQFVINPANQGMSPYNWQTAGNIISLCSALIAAALYGNIGIKVLYQNIFMELVKAPPLSEKKGKWIWSGIVPIYWSLAFIIAAAIPQFSNLSGLIAAVCILQFTYTFPPFLWIGYRIKKDAIRTDEGFDPATGRVTRLDSGMRRWVRGYKVHWLSNTLNFIYLLGAAVCAVLGAYSAIKGLIKGYSAGAGMSSFNCASPLGG